MKFSEQQYTDFNPFDGERDVKLTCRTVKLVKVRKPQQCYEGMSPDGKPHMIQTGDTARYEKALVDGDYWGRYYVCIPCMDAWMTECRVHPDGTAVEP